MGGMGRDQGCGLLPVLPLLLSRGLPGPHIAFSRGTSETTSFLLPLLVPSPQTIFLCFSGTRGLGSLRAVPTAKLLLKKLGCNEKPSPGGLSQAQQASSDFLSEFVRTGRGSPCVHGGVFPHRGCLWK